MTLYIYKWPLLFALLAFAPLFAQEPTPPMTFGELPKEDLDMKAYEPDSTAEAVVLCDFGNVTVKKFPNNYGLIFQHHKRIKILKNTGFYLGNVVIPFYSEDKTEEFFFDQAQVYLPDGRIVRLGKKDVFVVKVDENSSEARFSFPQIVEGCVIEYDYHIYSESIYRLRDWYFQEDIPVRWSEIRVAFPNQFSYTYYFQGNSGMFKVGSENGLDIYQCRNGIFSMGKGRFIFQQVPAMKPDAFVTSMNDYLTRIRFQLSEFIYPDGSVEKFMSDWPAVQKMLEESSYFGQLILKKGKHKKIAEDLVPMIGKSDSQVETARLLHQFLTGQVHWDSIHTIWGGQKQLDDAYIRQNANSAELNMMLLVLLNEAGIEAKPVLTSTRSNGKVHEEYPILHQFNYMVVLANLDGILC